MQLMEDVRYAVRQFLQAPGFTLTAILTLALGIGATTAIFTLVHAVLLKSMPVADPSTLYRIGDVENCCINGGLQNDWSLFSYDKYKTFLEETQGFTELAAFQAGRDLMGVRRSGSNQPAQSQRTQYVSGNYFSMFGVGSYAGRVFRPEDDRKGAEPVVVMSYATWQEKYGKDPSVIGARGRPEKHRDPFAGGVATMAVRSCQQVATRRASPGPQGDLASFPGGGWGSDDAGRVPIRPALVDVGIWLRVVDCLCQCCQPSSSTVRQPPSASCGANRAGRSALTADCASAYRERLAGAGRRGSRSSVRLWRHAPDSLPRLPE